MEWHLATIWDLVAEFLPENPAIAQGEKIITWSEYERRSACLASAFQELNLGHEGRVGILGHNSAEWLEAHYAAFKAGGIPFNVNYRYTEQELLYLLDDADAEIIVADAKLMPRVLAIRDRLPLLKACIAIEDGSRTSKLDNTEDFESLIATHQPLTPRCYFGDELYMLYTGGTTGMPKGVLYRQSDFTRLLMKGFATIGSIPRSKSEIIAALHELQKADLTPLTLPASPFMHGSGMALGAIVPHIMGGQVLIQRNEKFDAVNMWREVERARVTDIAIVGDAFAKPMVAALNEAEAQGRPFDLSSLRAISSSGMVFSQDNKLELLRFADIIIADMMSASEGTMGRSIVSRASPPENSSTFERNPSTKVFNEQDEEVRPGSDEIGMIATGGIVPVCYHKDQAKSAATFRSINGVRYSFPGDYAKIAADGSLILLGRGSNCINTGGEKVFCEEVEEALKAHPCVEDCLVIGTPDDRFGHSIVAVLSTSGGEPIPSELMDFCRSQIAGYKTPRRIIIVETVQRGPNGKADYGWAHRLAIEKQIA